MAYGDEYSIICVAESRQISNFPLQKSLFFVVEILFGQLNVSSH